MVTAKVTMVNTPKPGAGETKACKSPQPNPTIKPFPDYILCGSLNLHKSPVNAAALAKYIARQWDFLRINRNGIISSKQLEINRNPDAHGGYRDGKPLTVSEWEELQKVKLLDKRKQVAAGEAGPPVINDSSGASSIRGSSASNRRGSAGPRRGVNPVKANANLYTRTGSNITATTNQGICRGNRQGSRGRGGSRDSSRGRGGHKGMGSGCPPHPANIDNVGEVVDEIDKPAGTKLPRLARRNLRDKGDCLPRKRGPDKLSMS